MKNAYITELAESDLEKIWLQIARDNPAAVARFFDWTDLEVVQCLQAGPVEPDGVRLLRGLVRGRASD